MGKIVALSRLDDATNFRVVYAFSRTTAVDKMVELGQRSIVKIGAVRDDVFIELD